MWRVFLGCAAIIAAVVGEMGCESPAPSARTKRIPTLSVDARPANTAGLSTEEINRAAKLFVGKCARCHPLYDPTPYNDVEWGNWMTKMSKKAHLKAEQAELLSRYLGAFREAAAQAGVK
jgi:hypothetical protein